MHSKIVLVFIVIVATAYTAVVPTEEKSAAACGPITMKCTKTQECCSGCCTDGKCSECSHSPCSYYHCPDNKECYLQKVTCIQAPCNPVPACRPKDSDYDYS